MKSVIIIFLGLLLSLFVYLVVYRSGFADGYQKGLTTPMFKGEPTLHTGMQGWFSTGKTQAYYYKRGTYKIPDGYSVPYDSMEIIIDSNSTLVNFTYPKIPYLIDDTIHGDSVYIGN